MAIILCPTDFSPASERALQYAVDRFGADDVELRVLHVDDVPRRHGWEPSLERSLRQSWQERLDAMLTAHEGRARLTAATARGHAAEEILAHAEEIDASMIVMATRGRPALERLFLGAVTRKVVRGAHVPVLTLDPGARVGPVRRVLCPIDLSAPSAAVVAEAVRVAALWEARVHLLYVHGLPREGMFADGTGFVDPKLVEVLRQTVRRDLARFREQHGGASVVDARVVEGVPHVEILRAIDESEADLVVVGSHGHSGLMRWVLGSVAERLIRLAPVPVLTVRGGAPDADD